MEEEEIKKINLPDRYFKNGLKHSVLNLIIINGIILIIFFAILFYLFHNFYSKFEKEYKFKVTSNFSREIQIINNFVTNPIYKNAQINKLLKNYLKDKYINFIWISDNQGNLLFHSSESIKSQFPDLKNSAKYGFIFQHNWSFNPDGTVISIIKEKIHQNDTEIFFPIYNLNKKIDFIIEINFKKYLTRVVYIPKLNIYINIFYVVIISLCLGLIFLVILLTIIFSKIRDKKQDRRTQELITKLQEYQVDQLPFQFSFKEEQFKDNYFAKLIKYINQLLEKLNSKLKSKKSEDDKIRKVFSAAIFDSKTTKEKPEVLMKPTDIDLKQFLWGLYFKNKQVKSIPDYSTGIYHYYKENGSDMIFNYFDISSNQKGFFIGKTKQTDINKKILFLSLLNFMFHHNKKNILSADGYLANLNYAINNIGDKELELHAGYIILNTNSNYIEIASTCFSPLIHFKAKTGETAYYEFNSIALGKEQNDKFLHELKKESFQLFPGDIILLPDDNIENLTNFNRQKFEIYRIADIINENKSASADVITDKIKKTFNQFSVDFSKFNDLFILLIKRNKGNE